MTSRRLAQRGEKVRALVRVTSDKEKVEALQAAGVELCIGDLKQPESLAVACRDVSASCPPQAPPCHAQKEIPLNPSMRRDN